MERTSQAGKALSAKREDAAISGGIETESKMWFNPGSNRRPLVTRSQELFQECETNVITNYTIEPYLTALP